MVIAKVKDRGYHNSVIIVFISYRPWRKFLSPAGYLCK